MMMPIIISELIRARLFKIPLILREQVKKYAECFQTIAFCFLQDAIIEWSSYYIRKCSTVFFSSEVDVNSKLVQWSFKQPGADLFTYVSK